MHRILKVLLGFNAVSLSHLLRLKPIQFLGACARAFEASRDWVHRPAPTLADQIPEISLDEILGDRKVTLQLEVMRYEDGMLPSDQSMALLSVLAAESPTEVLEIGTYMGHTTRQMAENVPGAVIHTVDLPENFSAERDPNPGLPKDDFHLISRRVVGREFNGRACATRIRQHFGDTATWNFREAGHPTFFFIDGAHSYAYCKNDSEKCFDLCGGRGVFLWHDCDATHPGVMKFLAEWRRAGRDIRRIAGTPIAYWKSSEG